MSRKRREKKKLKNSKIERTSLDRNPACSPERLKDWKKLIDKHFSGDEYWKHGGSCSPLFVLSRYYDEGYYKWYKFTLFRDVRPLGEDPSPYKDYIPYKLSKRTQIFK